jgi:hypothetical protein
MYESVVYFAGPETKWAEKVSEREVIARFNERYRWLARIRASVCHAQLDPARCGYAVLRDGETLAHIRATE